MSEKERIGQLTEQARKGSREAFEELYTLFDKRLYYFCLHLLDDEEEAVTVTRDTFVYAWKNIDSLPASQTFYRWICGNAFYFAQNLRISRRGAGFSVRPGDGNDAFYDMMVKASLPSQEPTVKRSDLNTVSNLLAGLPDSERICVLLHDYAGFGIEATASLAGCAEDSAKAHVYNGRTAIRDGLDAREPGAGQTFFPFLPRLLKTCGRNCPVPAEVLDGVRAVLSGDREESAYVSSVPEIPDADGKPDRGKLITIICAILGVIILAGGIYLVWLFINRFEPTPSISDPVTSAPAETSAEISAPAVSDPVSEEPSVPDASSLPAESSVSTDVSAPVESSTEPSADTSVPPEESLPQESSQAPAVRTGTVTADSLRLRSSPDTTKNNILTSIPGGTKVTIIGETKDAAGGTWYQVQYQTFEGYCSAEFIVVF